MLFSKWSQFIHIDFKQLRQTLNFPLRTLILIIDSENLLWEVSFSISTLRKFF